MSDKMKGMKGRFILFEDGLLLFFSSEEEAEYAAASFGSDEPRWVSLVGDPYEGMFQVDIPRHLHV